MLQLPDKPRREPFKHTIGVAFGLVLAMVGIQTFLNPNFQWDVVAKYFFSPLVLHGLGNTIALTVISMVIGTLLGLLSASMQQSKIVAFRAAASLYIWFFRGTPLLVQLIFWYNLAIAVPQVLLWSAGGGFEMVSTNTVITPFLAAVLGLSLNEGAYMSEVIRGGLLSVSKGQREAAYVLGMSSRTSFVRIILPQAMRIIIPPTGNQLIGMLKTTSLVSVISTPDLLYSVQAIYGRTFETIPLLLVASIWYLAVTTVLTAGQHVLEKRLSRGSTHA